MQAVTHIVQAVAHAVQAVAQCASNISSTNRQLSPRIEASVATLTWQGNEWPTHLTTPGIIISLLNKGPINYSLFYYGDGPAPWRENGLSKGHSPLSNGRWCYLRRLHRHAEDHTPPERTGNSGRFSCLDVTEGGCYNYATHSGAVGRSSSWLVLFETAYGNIEKYAAN